jgi:hypothetical protein
MSSPSSTATTGVKSPTGRSVRFAFGSARPNGIPERQWLLEVYDYGRNDRWTFAMRDVIKFDTDSTW